MELSDLNPYIRYARAHLTHLGGSLNYSICYDCRIFFAENAEGYVIANEKKYNISNGTLIYFPPLTKYRFSLSENENFKMIVLDFDLINDFSYLETSIGTTSPEKFDPEKELKYPICEPLSDPIIKLLPLVGDYLNQCTENYLIKDSLYREISSALLKICLLELIRKSAKKSAYSKLCDDVIEYIYENHALQSLSNSMIAQQFNYHPYHLNFIVKNETGKSLHRHLIETRLNFAKNYLLTTSYNIEQISWKSGFSSTSYFIKCFKELSGITPKKYRQLRFIREL